MPFTVYNLKSALSIKPSVDSRKTPNRNTVLFTFVPVKAKNPNGLGQTYDWKAQLVYMFTSQNALLFANQIKIALRDQQWSRCSIIHKNKDVEKILNISMSGDTFFINARSGQTSFSVSLKLESLLSLIDYLTYTALNQLKVEDDQWLLNRKDNAFANNIDSNDQPSDAYDLTFDENQPSTNQPSTNQPKKGINFSDF